MTEPQPRLSFRGEIRSLPGPVWTLSAGIFFDRFGTYVFPFLVLFLTDRGVANEMAGMAAGMMGVGGLLAAGLGGYLADRVGRKNTITISMGGSAVMGLLLYGSAVASGALGGYWATFLCSMAYGTLRGMYYPASHSLIADVVPADRRVAAFAVLRFAINLGWAIGMTAAGFLAEFSFFLLFLIDALTSLIYGIVAFLFLPHGLRTEKETAGWPRAWQSIRRNPMFILVFVNGLVVSLIFVQWSSSYAVYIRDFLDFEHPKRVYGIIMAFNGFLVAAFELPISAVVRRYSAPAMIALGTAIAAIGFGMNALLGTFTGLAVAALVFTLGEMISMPVQGAYVSQLAPDDMRGRYNGAMGLTWSTTNIVGPVFGLWLLGFGPAILCGALVVAGVAGSAILLVGASRFGAPRKI